MERRTFMKYTAAAGASLMLHPFEPFASNPAKKIRLALVGTGFPEHFRCYVFQL
jgi:hypothetical protein